MTTDTAINVNTQSNNGSRLLQGKVTQVEKKRGLFGQEIKSFSIMTNDREVLVTLPKRIALSFAVGSEVWVTGDRAGPLRVQADMIFLPRLQHIIDLRQMKGPPHRSFIGMTLFSLMLLLQNPELVFLFIVIPAVMLYSVLEKRPVRPVLSIYDTWDLIERQIKHPDQDLLHFRENSERYLLERIIYGIWGFILIWADLTMYILPLGMFSQGRLPYDSLMYSLIVNVLLFTGIVMLTSAQLVEIVGGVRRGK